MDCTTKKRLTAERDATRVRTIAEHEERRAAKKPMLAAPSEPNTEGLICWWCVHALPQLPCFHLPINYDYKLDRFYTRGNFCSWECMKAYAIDMNTSHSGEIQSFLALMRMKAFGRYERLCAAPKRTALKIFGGTMTIEEFRSCYGKPPPPVVFPNDKQLIQVVNGTVAVDSVETAAPVSTATSNSRKLKAIEDTQVKAETLKLKRNKPLERSKSKLESTLGITRKPK